MPPDVDAGVAEMLRRTLHLDGFEEEHSGTVLARSKTNQQSLALQKQAMRLKKASEGTVLQRQTARLVEDRARKAPGRALSRR